MPVPASPLPVSYPPLGEGRDLDSIGIQAGVEVLYLYAMLAGRHAIDYGLPIPPQPAAFS